MIGLLIFKLILKTGVVIAKKSAVKKASVLGLIAASGAEEYSRKKRYEKPNEHRPSDDIKNNEDKIEMI